MKQFGLQLWSVRDYFTTERAVADSFRAIADMGYTTAQTAGTYDFIRAQVFREYADAAGVRICGTHYEWDRMLHDIPGTIAYHRALGTSVIGIGGMPGVCMESEDALSRFIAQFNRLSRTYAQEGFVLSYHNHAKEFCKCNGKNVYDRLIEELDPQTTTFCLDVYWAQYAGMDVRALIERLRGRIRILHLKDMESWRAYSLADGNTLYAPGMIEIGKGNINFPDIIRTARACGVSEFVVEDEYYSTGNSMESVKMSADYIRAHLLTAEA